MPIDGDPALVELARRHPFVLFGEFGGELGDGPCGLRSAACEPRAKLASWAEAGSWLVDETFAVRLSHRPDVVDLSAIALSRVVSVPAMIARRSGR